MIFKIGTRCSNLALIQAECLKNQLLPYFDKIEIIPIKTSGDKIKGALYDVGGKGLFIKELESALLSKTIDLAVHSMKDIPANYHHDLAILPVLKRQSPNDVLISFLHKSLDSLPTNAKIGTCAPRRMMQLGKNIQAIPLRGNIETRIKKAENLDGIIIAECALQRLNKTQLITEVISVKKMLPAVCQGVIAAEFRKDNNWLKNILDNLVDNDTYTTSKTEREFLKTINGDCTTPLAALATLQDEKIFLKAMLSSQKGVFFTSKNAHKSQAQELGKNAAEELMKLCY